MTQPSQNLCRRLDPRPVRHDRAFDHQHRQLQDPGGLQLRRGTASAGVFRDDHLDAMDFQKRQIGINGKRTARHRDLDVGQGQGVRRINEPQKVLVFGLCRKIRKALPADGEENPTRVIGQGRHRRRDIRDMGPLILVRCNPGQPLKCQQGNASLGAGSHRIRAHLCGERMCGVDDMGDSLAMQILDKTRNSAKTTDPCRQGLRQRCLGSSGIRIDAVNPGRHHGAGEQACITGSAQNEDAAHG